jgi:hypothetical protein
MSWTRGDGARFEGSGGDLQTTAMFSSQGAHAVQAAELGAVYFWDKGLRYMREATREDVDG